jgi:tetratricopeptide (TPR) repeat protein
MYERAQSLRPEDYQAPSFLAQSYRSLGMLEESRAADRRAVKLMLERLDLNPSDARAANLLAATYGALGETDKAAEYAAKSLGIDPDDAMLLYNVCCTYSLIGRKDEAIDCLERAVDKGFGHREWIDNDPDLAAIRDNPRFQAIMRGM